MAQTLDNTEAASEAGPEATPRGANRAEVRMWYYMRISGLIPENGRSPPKVSSNSP